MKNVIVLLLLVLFFFLSGNLFSQVVVQRTHLDGNNIDSYLQNTGIFNQNTTSGNSPGFIWPKGSGKTAIFSSGLSIGARVNGQIAQSMASYKGEFAPGFILNGVATTNPNFKIYKISRGDNEGNNPDYANWYLMIPYGAPYIDVNNNQQYDTGIDSVGIRYASQVIFICMTDGFASSHNVNEGFGGGITSPMLNSQISWTSWCYDRIDLLDMQFIKWGIINKSNSAWNSAYFSIVSDPDMGNPLDDYIGCNIDNNLGYCYNKTNNDQVYGTNPPAAGFMFLNSPRGFTSFNFFTDASISPPPCESDPIGAPLGAYRYMKGFKKDSSNFMDPTSTPPKPSKFVYSGLPEPNTGWTEYKGSIQNCGGNTGNVITENPSGDRRFIMSSGAEDYTVNPNDTVTIYASQLIARGTSNTNSVTKLINYCNSARSVFNNGFTLGIQNISTEIPSSFSLSQNYPNPFNPSTKIRFGISRVGQESQFVTLKVFDVMGREVQILVNESLQPGTYEITFDGSKLTSGIYFYRIITNSYTETKRMLLIK